MGLPTPSRDQGPSDRRPAAPRETRVATVARINGRARPSRCSS